MYAIYGDICHQYTPNVSMNTIHGSYGQCVVGKWFPGEMDYYSPKWNTRPIEPGAQEFSGPFGTGIGTCWHMLARIRGMGLDEAISIYIYILYTSIYWFFIVKSENIHPSLVRLCIRYQPLLTIHILPIFSPIVIGVKRTPTPSWHGFSWAMES